MLIPQQVNVDLRRQLQEMVTSSGKAAPTDDADVSVHFSSCPL